MKNKLNILLLLNIILVSCCIQVPLIPKPATFNETTTTFQSDATTTAILPDITLPGTQKPYYLKNSEYTRYDDPDVKPHSLGLTAGCEDDECRVARIHQYAIENFYYLYDENTEEGTNALFAKGYGDNENFAQFYFNYLMASGVDAKIALIEGQPYALACGIDLDRLQSYIEADQGFKSFVQETLFPGFEFELDYAFGRECMRLEGPSDTLGVYMYPGQQRDPSPDENSYYIDPVTGEWEWMSEMSITKVSKKPHFKREYNFTLGANSVVDWNLAFVVEKEAWFIYEYRFDAYDIAMEVDREYARFTLPELSRFDRARMKITIDGTEPFLFFTLENEQQFAGLDYVMRERDPDKTRIELENTGQLPWEFYYLRACSQETPAEHFEKECVIPDAGRRVFVIYNDRRLNRNDVNVTIEYLEFL